MKICVTYDSTIRWPHSMEYMNYLRQHSEITGIISSSIVNLSLNKETFYSGERNSTRVTD
jgi:hypothetical protein